MAKDKNNIHDLAAESDEDTSELEILPDTIAADPEYDYESESDAATHAFESLNRKHEDKSLTELRSVLRERDETINRLEYDIELLRARWTGLETELKARVELTRNVTTELDLANQELNEALERIKNRERKVTSLETSMHALEERLRDADLALAAMREEAKSSQSEVADVNDRNAVALTRIDALMSELTTEKSERKQAQDAVQSHSRNFGELQARQAESQSQVASLEQYIEGRKEHWERQESELRTKDQLLKDQHLKISRFTKDVKHDSARLRRETAARRDLQTQHEILQKDNERLNNELVLLQRDVNDSEELLRNEQLSTDSLKVQLDDAVQSLAEVAAARETAAHALQARQDEVSSLRSEISDLTEVARANEVNLERQQQTIEELSRQIEETGERLSADESARQELESQRDRLQTEADQLREDNDILNVANTKQEESIARQLAEIDKNGTALQDKTQQLESARSDREALSEEHAVLREQAEQLASEVTALRGSAANEQLLKQANFALSGMVAGHAATIKELTEQISRTESYADTLRMKLQSQLAESESLASGRQNLEASLNAARDRIDKLTAELEAERQSASGLSQEKLQIEKNFEQEVRQIRFELEAAEETVAESQLTNEQLKADLIDNSGFRRTLESQLAESDATSKREIEDLSGQLAQLKKQIDEYERKVANKDAAINALLSELANKPEVETPERESAAVVHRLADRKPQHNLDDKQGPEKDRVTRLLLGNIDGQELRFPLFKDKLTIGRTAHNDIQLKAQYVSRRHAVVVTDDDCTRIVDWGSKNGIYVNGVRVTEKILKNGDKLTVGTAQFRFEERQKR